MTELGTTCRPLDLLKKPVLAVQVQGGWAMGHESLRVNNRRRSGKPSKVHGSDFEAIYWTMLEAASLQGRFNNQRLVAESAAFTWSSKWGGREVFVTGDFTSWTVSHNAAAGYSTALWMCYLTQLLYVQELIPLRQNGSGFKLSCSLPVSIRKSAAREI